ncbi:MAG: hypothetical protein LBT51_03540 [Fusobacteriaceae bacterium]|jgi:type IV secretory pathway TrbD component|nr:hypothetical protein [Fusobacteriaceae bacterium]
MKEKICKALIVDITIAGGARIPVILNAGSAFCMLYIRWYLIFIFILTHILIVDFTKKDGKFFEHFIESLKYNNRYES